MMITLNDIKTEYQMIVAVNYDFEISLEDYVRKFYIKVSDIEEGYYNAITDYWKSRGYCWW